MGAAFGGNVPAENLEVFSLAVRQFQFNKLFYGFLMVIDHIGRSKKTFICTCILLCILPVY